MHSHQVDMLFLNKEKLVWNKMDRMGLFPEKASAEVNKIRNCAYQHNMGFQEKIEKSEDIYQIAFESFPDVVGALAVKKAGFKGTPKFFCEMLKAEQKALRHPKLDAGHSGNQHGSALFRSLLVHQQINDKTPKSCSNYLEQIQSKQKFKSCF